MFANGCRQRQAQVGVDIDFAYAEFAGPQQHIFRDALRSVNLAAELVAFGDKLRQYGGSTVQYQWEIGQQGRDFFQSGKIQRRIALEFIGAMAGTDGNCQRIDAGAFDELHCLVRVGV